MLYHVTIYSNTTARPHQPFCYHPHTIPPASSQNSREHQTSDHSNKQSSIISSSAIMIYIALLVFAAVAMGAVLGEDQRAKLVPRVYTNTTCVLTDDMSSGGANADAVAEAIQQLKGRTDKCSADPGLDNCQSLYCSQHSSIK